MTERHCSCWLTLHYHPHGGHCCFSVFAPSTCHEAVLDAADKITGSRDATLALDTRTKARLLAEIIATRYPRSA